MTTADASIERVRPAGRVPLRRRPPRRPGLAAAGISLWGWTLFVLALAILMWELPFFRASGECCGSPLTTMDLPVATHGADLELGPLLMVETTGQVRLESHSIGRAGEPDEEMAEIRREHSAFSTVGHDPAAQTAHLRVVPDRASVLCARILSTYRRNWAVLHPSEPFTGALLVAAERGSTWGALRPFFEVAREEGYTRLHFIVSDEARENDLLWDQFRTP